MIGEEGVYLLENNKQPIKKSVLFENSQFFFSFYLSPEKTSSDDLCAQNKEIFIKMPSWLLNIFQCHYIALDVSDILTTQKIPRSQCKHHMHQMSKSHPVCMRMTYHNIVNKKPSIS